VDPMARSRVAVGHGGALQGQNGSMEKSGIIAIGSTNVIKTENGNKELKFAAVDKRDKRSRKRNGVDGSAGGGRSNQQWNRAGEDGIESKLRVEKVKSPKMRGAGSTGRGKDGGHFGRQSSRGDRKGRGGSSSSSSGTKDEVLDLSSRKKNKAIGV
jgi:hypothetical protein